MVAHFRSVGGLDNGPQGCAPPSPWDLLWDKGRCRDGNGKQTPRAGGSSAESLMFCLHKCNFPF